MKSIDSLKIPLNYAKYLSLFKKNVSFLLFKQTNKLNEEIGGLDVLFNTKKDYFFALNLLLNKNFQVYLSEKNEPYKTMLVKYENGFLLIFHLQRKIAWLGMDVIDHERMFKHIIPSKEDSLLIHAAHILFENYEIRYEKKIFDLFKNNVDYKHIDFQLNKYGWKKEFFEVINDNLTKKTIIKAHINRFLRQDFFKLCFVGLKQAIQFLTKRINPKTKGLLVSFTGVNGCGKSTLSKELVEKYNKTNEKLKLKADYYYFGWVPFLFLTKFLSKTISKKNIYKTAVEEKTPKFSIKYELFFLYLFLDYFARYLFLIYPKLNKRIAVISDRYFYHVYGQYPYSQNSILLPLLVKFFPKPDFTFFINTDLNTLQSRRKDIPKEQLKSQQKRYLKLKQLNRKIFVLVPMSKEKTIEQIYKKIWVKQFKKLKY